jgi:hypothetical protein
VPAGTEGQVNPEMAQWMDFLSGMFVGCLLMGMIWIHESRVSKDRDKLKRRL